MLDEYEASLREAKARKQASLDGERTFFERFAELRRTVVRPVFERAGAIFHERGHGFEIHEEEFAAGASGHEASIRLRLTPAGMEEAAANDERRRELSFATRHYNRSVSIVNGAAPESGAMAGAAGCHDIARIDRRFVEEEVLKLMAGLVRRS
jgi:hypothetical protein